MNIKKQIWKKLFRKGNFSLKFNLLMVFSFMFIALLSVSSLAFSTYINSSGIFADIIGIGTMSPGETFHVSGIEPWFRIETTVAGNEAGMKWVDAGTTKWELYKADGTNNKLFLDNGTFNNHIMTWLQNGNVGIGTSSPSNILTIGTEGGGNKVLAIKGSDATGGKEGGEIRLFLADDNDTTANYWYIDVFEEQLRVYPSGGGGGVHLDNVTSTTWTSASDIRLKKNIVTTSVLNRIDDFRLIEFDWKASGKHDTGVIAQEVYEAFPLVVSVGEDILGENNEGAWGVQYSKLAPIALQGVKELKGIIQEQQSEIQLLKSELCSRDPSYSWC